MYLLQRINELALNVIYEEENKKNQQRSISGAEEAALMKVGTQVVRGPDWKWGDQDGCPSAVGTVVAGLADDGWIRVQWNTGETNSYRSFEISAEFTSIIFYSTTELCKVNLQHGTLQESSETALNNTIVLLPSKQF